MRVQTSAIEFAMDLIISTTPFAGVITPNIFANVPSVSMLKNKESRAGVDNWDALYEGFLWEKVDQWR